MQELIAVHKKQVKSELPSTEEEVFASLDRALDDIRHGRFRKRA